MNIDQIKDRAQGHWPGILIALGASRSHLSGKHGPCPWCDGTDRFRFDDRDGQGTFLCNQCGAGDGMTFASRLLQLEDSKDLPKVAEAVARHLGVHVDEGRGSDPHPADPTSTDGNSSANKHNAMRVWEESIPDSGPVSAYLAGRAIVVPVDSNNIRYNPKINAMVALVRSVAGEPTAIHRTFLGTGVPKDKRKMMLGPVKNCAVHLAEPTDGILATGEGIESCLSFQQPTGIPVWAGLTEGGVRDFVPPENVHQLYLLADVDEPIIIRGVMRRVGQEAARKAAQRIANMGIAVFIVWPGDPEGPKVDFNDLLKADPSGQSIRDVLARAEPVHPHEKPVQAAGNDWLNLLRVGATGVLPNLSNAATVLENHPAFDGMLAFDDFRQAFVLKKRPPWDQSKGQFKYRDVDDNDITSLARWMQGPTLGQYAMARLGIETARQAADNVGYKVHIHPVRDWIGSLKWDKSPRLSTWLRDFLGVEDTAYSRAVARAWMISAIARIYQPGCKADGVLVLVGDQGAKKSQALNVIGGKWFRDTVFDLTNKDAFVQLRGAWIYELAELSALAKAEVERVKAFMSSQQDVFRPPFGRTIVEVPRQLVFAATTNQFEFLKDQTGNRRFWPVEVTKIELKALECAREQLIAEAVSAYKSGEGWWLSSADEKAARTVQKEHLAVDPWEAKVYAIIDGRDHCTVSEILYSIEPDYARWLPGWDARVGTILTNLGWRKARRTDGKGGRERRYVKSVQPCPNEVPPDGQGVQGGSDENSQPCPEKKEEKQCPVQGVQGRPGFFPIESENEPFMRAGVAHAGAHDTCAHAHSKTGAYRKQGGHPGHPGHPGREEENDDDNVVPIRPPRRPL